MRPDRGEVDERTLPATARGEPPTPWPAGDDDLAPPTIPGYESLELIGVGGMGIVYKARQVELQRVVAIKMILAGPFASAEEIRRFKIEAEAAARLSHPGIVPIYEFGQAGRHRYFSMKLIEGRSLQAMLTDGPLAPRRAAELVLQTARAVHYAHECGVIHRDLKPSNVVIDAGGAPCVLDFGLAKLVAGTSELTVTGQTLGTPSYMPPEQARGRIHDVTPAVDVYALGAILYAITTGRPPFLMPSQVETLLALQVQPPVPPRQRVRAIPRDLETIILKCLEKDAGRRYASAAGLAEDLRRFLADEPIAARPVGALARLWRWCRRKPGTAIPSAGFFALLLVLVIGGWTALLRLQREHDETLRSLERAEAAESAATENLRLAEHAAQRYLSEIADDPRLKEADLLALRRQLLEAAIPLLMQLTARSSDDFELGLTRGRALLSLARLRHETADHAASLADAAAAAAQFADLNARAPERTDVRFEQIRVLEHQATVLQTQDDRERRDQILGDAIVRCEALLADDPDDPGARYQLALLLREVGIKELGRGDMFHAEQAFARMIEVLRALIVDYPDELEYRYRLAGALTNIGLVMNNLGDHGRWLIFADEGLAVARALVERDPRSMTYREILMITLNNLAVTLPELGRRDEADVLHEEARQAIESLVADFPSVQRFRVTLAKLRHYRTDGLRIDGHLDEALTELADIAASLLELRAQFGKDEDVRITLRDTYAGQALVHEAQGRFAAAAESWRLTRQETVTYESQYYGIRRATAWLRDGQVARALQEIEAVLTAEPLQRHPQFGHPLYHAAVFFAQAADAARERDTGARHRARAAQLLRAAELAAPEDSDRMLALPELAALPPAPPAE